VPQVITPPAPGQEEDRSKNWYKAEALRKIKADLAVVHNECQGWARDHIEYAMAEILQAQGQLSEHFREEALRARMIDDRTHQDKERRMLGIKDSKDKRRNTRKRKRIGTSKSPINLSLVK
jgi:hypothetical protein